MQNLFARLAAFAVLTVAVQACVPKDAPVAASRARLYSTDQQGAAAICAAPPVTPLDGREVAAKINTGGGGWCGLLVSKDGNPFASSLLVQAPRNGRAYIHAVGDDTRIDYTPKPGPVAADSFAVRLIPGDAIVRVTVGPALPPAK